MNQFVVLVVGIGAIWTIFMMTVGSKSTVWILKNRETYIALAIGSTVLSMIFYFILLKLADIKSLYLNVYVVVTLNFISFLLLRVYIHNKKAPEEKDLSEERTKQYRVFDNIDLEDRFKDRQGELITWNMQGDEAYEIVNVDTKKIIDRVSGLRDIITDEIGFPIGIEITANVRNNLAKILENTDNFENVVGYKLNESKNIISKEPLYSKLFDILKDIYKLYPKVLGELDFDQTVDKFGNIELALLNSVNRLAVKKIPINIVQLYALVKSDLHSDLLGAIKNIVQERTVQKEGIYLYSLYMIRYAQVYETSLDQIKDETVMNNIPLAVEEEVL
jgi:hypothetical protein